MQEQAAPAQAESPEQDGPNEDQIVDQIGALISQLSPEKQKVLVMKLGEMVGGGSGTEPVSSGSPDAGMTGTPVGERV